MRADLLDVFLGHRLGVEPVDAGVEGDALKLRVCVGCHAGHPRARNICVGAQLSYLYGS